MLAGVDQQLLVLLTQEMRHGRGLHELGAVADYGGDSHRLNGRIMPSDTTKNLLDAAADLVRHFAWYIRYQAGTAGPRDA